MSCECPLSVTIHLMASWMHGLLPQLTPTQTQFFRIQRTRLWLYHTQRMEDVLPALCELFSLGFHLTGYALNCSKNAYCTLIQIWLQTCEQFLAQELLRSNNEWPIGNALKTF